MQPYQKIALIPAYMPDDKMTDTVRSLSAEGFDVVLVNDGSPGEYDALFSDAPYTHIISYPDNRGKGAALKAGLAYIKAHYQPPYTVVTADADGQHRTEDIVRVTEVAAANRGSLILGSRRLEGKVPFKSRAGNAITRQVFRLSTGVKVYDTQTGLRAFSDRLIDKLLSIEGSRYEYEMNVLLCLAKEGWEIKEEPIQTVYINNNAASHFDPVKDSAKIYKEILKYSASSLLSFLIDYGLFCLLSALTGSLIFSNISARLISGSVNFTLNRNVVFKSNENAALSALKYIALAGFILICNTLLLKALTAIRIAAYLAKILTEIVLFFINYIIQHTFVFRKEKKAV